MTVSFGFTQNFPGLEGCNANPVTGDACFVTVNGVPTLSIYNGSSWVRGPSKYAVLVGDGAEDTFTITHALSTEDVVVVVYNADTGAQLAVTSVTITDENSLELVLGAAPDEDNARVVVIG